MSHKNKCFLMEGPQRGGGLNSLTEPLRKIQLFFSSKEKMDDKNKQEYEQLRSRGGKVPRP